MAARQTKGLHSLSDATVMARALLEKEKKNATIQRYLFKSATYSFDEITWVIYL